MGEDSWATSLIEAEPGEPLYEYKLMYLGDPDTRKPKPAPPPENPVYKLIRESIAKHKNSGNTATAKE